MRRWVFAAGGKVEAAEGVEVSPTVSYAGEGLVELCRGRSFAQPHDAALQVRRKVPVVGTCVSCAFQCMLHP